MTVIDYGVIDLQWEFMNHLVVPESAMYIYREHLDLELFDEGDDTRIALQFLQDYVAAHKISPTPEIWATEGWSGFEETTVPVEYVIQKLRDRYKRRQMKVASKQVVDLSVEDLDAALHFGISEYSRILTETDEQSENLSTNDLDLVLERYGDEKEAGLSIGYPEIDEAYNGIRGLTFAVGITGSFKSWQAIKSAVSNLEQGHSSVIFPLEMTAAETQNRLACMLAGVSWNDFTHKQLSSRSNKLLSDAADWHREQEHKIHIVDPPAGRRTVAHMKQIATNLDAEIMYIDQFYDIEPSRKFTSGWEEKGHIVHELKAASRDIPVFCLAQFTRQASGLREMANLEHIGLTVAIGQKSDLVMGLHTTRGMTKNGLIRYGAIKGRDVELLTWEVKVELNEWSNFRISGVVEYEDEEA